MTAVIWKYPVNLGVNKIAMPLTVRPIKLGHQGGQLMMWAIVEPSETQIPRAIRIIGTGFEFDPKEWRYVDSTMVDGYVWHLIIERNINGEKGEAL